MEMRFPGFVERVKDRCLPPLPMEAAANAAEYQGREWKELKSPDISKFPLNLPNRIE